MSARGAGRGTRPARRLRLRAARGLGLAALLLGASPAPAAVDADPCRGTMILAPRAYYVGEQILHRVRLERQANAHEMRWIRAPAFPDFRVEALPGRAEQSEAGPHGATRYVREQHRSLFPARAGSLEIPASGFECRTEPGGRSFRTSLPASTIEVQHPPSAGQPDDYAGLVGPVGLEVTAGARSVVLGAALELKLVMHGPSNLWDQPAPSTERLQAGDGARFDVYPGEARIDLERGTALTVRSTRSITLVPREVGVLRVPPLRVVSFEPDRQRYAIARSAPIEVRVTATPGHVHAPATPATNAAAPDAAAGGAWVRWAFGVLLAALIALAANAARRARARGAPLRAAAREAAREADAPERVRAAALERALHVALEARSPGVAAGMPGAAAGSASPDLNATRILDAIARLERLRFDRDPPRVDLDEIERLLGAANRRSLRSVLGLRQG